MTTTRSVLPGLVEPDGLLLERIETPAPGPHDGSGPFHVAFSIAAADLQAWQDHLIAASVTLEGRTRWPRGGTSVYFRDPDDHLLEIATPGLWKGY